MAKKIFWGSFFAWPPATAINAQSEMGGKKVKAKSAFGSLSGARNTEGKTENVHMRKRPSSSHICFEQASNYLKASPSSPSQRPPTRRRRHICAKTDKGSFFCQRIQTRPFAMYQPKTAITYLHTSRIQVHKKSFKKSRRNSFVLSRRIDFPRIQSARIAALRSNLAIKGKSEILDFSREIRENERTERRKNNFWPRPHFRSEIFRRYLEPISRSC